MYEGVGVKVSRYQGTKVSGDGHTEKVRYLDF